MKLFRSIFVKRSLVLVLEHIESTGIPQLEMSPFYHLDFRESLGGIGNVTKLP